MYLNKKDLPVFFFVARQIYILNFTCTCLVAAAAVGNYHNETIILIYDIVQLANDYNTIILLYIYLSASVNRKKITGSRAFFKFFFSLRIKLPPL